MADKAVTEKSPTESKGNNWVWTVVRGVLALGLGLFLLISSATAPVAIAYALAIYLALSGALQAFGGFLRRRSTGSGTDRLRGLVGFIGGLALLLLLWFDVITLSTAYTVLAVLLIVYGILGLFEEFFDRGAGRFSWMSVIINALLVVLGVMVFVARSQGFDLRLWSGLVLAIIGVILLVYGLFIQRKKTGEVLSNA